MATLRTRKYGTDTDPLNQYVWHPIYIDALAVRYWDQDLDGNLAENNDVLLFLYDANFNVTAVINSSSTVLERYHYTPYGEVAFLDSSFATRSSSLIGNTHLYTGRERDPETGLQLNRHRFYSSWLGRWLTRDPIGYLDSLAEYDLYQAEYDLYQYVMSMPTGFVDPSGLLSRKDCMRKLASLVTDVKEINDHHSWDHCGSVKAVINTFLSGGCRFWHESLKDQVTALIVLYNYKCTPETPIEIRMRFPRLTSYFNHAPFHLPFSIRIIRLPFSSLLLRLPFTNLLGGVVSSRNRSRGGRSLQLA